MMLAATAVKSAEWNDRRIQKQIEMHARNIMPRRTTGLFRFLSPILLIIAGAGFAVVASVPRERISMDDGWRFTQGDPTNDTVSLLYDPTCFIPFPSHDRNAFSGKCLAIVRGKAGQPGKITITATAEGLKAGTVSIETRNSD